MCGHRFWIGATSLVFLAVSGPAGAADGEASEPGGAVLEARALAREIDRVVAAKWAEAGAEPATPADDAEYLRRVSIDLIGKIPTAAEAEEFLDDPARDKRAQLVDRLLA